MDWFLRNLESSKTISLNRKNIFEKKTDPLMGANASNKEEKQLWYFFATLLYCFILSLIFDNFDKKFEIPLE